MGVITLKIDDDLEKRLRRRVGEKGAARGALSAGVEEALSMWLGPRKKETRYFVAKRRGTLVAEDATLDGLAAKLRDQQLGPGDVTIESVPPVPATVRMGVRITEVAESSA